MEKLKTRSRIFHRCVMVDKLAACKAERGMQTDVHTVSSVCIRCTSCRQSMVHAYSFIVCLYNREAINVRLASIPEHL